MATNPHIYVSSVVGTNTGASDTSKATQQTGNITSMTASDVYTTLEAAINGASPDNGDTVYLCDNHSGSYGLAAITGLGPSSYGEGIRYISVDNTNIDTAKAGAVEQNTNSNSWALKYTGYVYGVDFTNADNVFTASVSDINWTFENCIIRISGYNDIGFNITGDGSTLNILDSDIYTSTSNAWPFKAIGGNVVNWFGGKLYATGTMTPYLFATNGTNGGGKARFVGVDLSLLSTEIMKLPTIAGTTDNLLIRIEQCQLHASLSLPTPDTELDAVNHRFEMFNCDDSTGGDLARLYIADGAGSVRSNASVYNSNNPAFFEGSVKSSLEVRTTASCSQAGSFDFEVITQYIDLSDTSSDKITINLVSNFTMTSSDISAHIVYPDGTTPVSPNHITSMYLPVGGSTLSTSALDATDWTGEPTSPNFYKLDLDTSVDAGSAFAITVKLKIFKPSIDGTTNKLFIDPVLEVGT